MSCKIKQRETWHCANSFPNSKAARWRKREQDSPLRNTASSNLEYRLGLENSGKQVARCKERELDNKTEQKIYVRAPKSKAKMIEPVHKKSPCQDNTQFDKIVTGSEEVMQQQRGDGNSVAKETARMPISHELHRKTPNKSQIKKARNPISAFRTHN
jgi:hypothetical protein